MSVISPVPFLQCLDSDSEKHRYVKAIRHSAYLYLITNGGGTATVFRRIVDLLIRTKRGRASRELGTALRPGWCSGRKVQCCEGWLVGDGRPSGANLRRIVDPSNASQ